MLMYGDSEAASHFVTTANTVIFNMTSLSDTFTTYLPLIPPNNLGANSEYDFDMKYMHWIMDNDSNFYIFMSIIINIERGFHVFIVIDYSDWSVNLVESLLKLIQQRYGIIAVRVDNLDDFLFANECNFTDFGVRNFDIDLERYSYLNMYFEQQVQNNKENKYTT